MLGRLQIALSILAASIGTRISVAQNALDDHPVAPAEYQFIADTLKLDENQRITLATLYDGSQAAFKAEAQRLHDQRQKYKKAQVEKTPDENQLREEFFQGIVDFMSFKREFDRSFMADVRALLSKDQMRQHWPVVERAHRRNLLRVLYPDTATVWNHADLIRCVKDAKLAPEAEQSISPRLLEYEIKLDEILIQRERFFWSANGTYLNPSNNDAEQNAQLIAKNAAELNKKHAKILLAALPDEEARKLEIRIYGAAYTHLYGSLICEEANALPKALQLENLRPDQRQDLEELDKKWQSDLADFRRRGRAAYDRADADMLTIHPAERRAFKGDLKLDPAFKAWVDVSTWHAELSKNFAARMRKILTPEQQRTLLPPAQPAIDPKTAAERGAR